MRTTFQLHLSKGMSGLGLWTIMAFSAMANAANQQPWIRDEASSDHSAYIYLSKDFSTKVGQFKAMAESVLAKEDTLKGEFLVGTYRYVYKRPVRQDGGVMADELISTELLSCNDRFYGTLKRTLKLKGKIVSEKINDDVLMVQTSGVNLGSKLCELHAGNPPSRLERKAINNPRHNPNPTAKDIDALIDKYATPGAGAAK
jgi:hypothetical protein